jgi:hypothetical protein
LVLVMRMLRLYMLLRIVLPWLPVTSTKRSWLSLAATGIY